MLFISGGRFARGRLGGIKRVRVQALNPPAPPGGNPTPAVNVPVTFAPVDADAFEFHDGNGTDEITTDTNGIAECDVTCKRQGVCRLMITCPGHPDEHLDIEVDVTTGTTVSGTGGGGAPMILRREPRAPAPVAPQIIVID